MAQFWSLPPLTSSKSSSLGNCNKHSAPGCVKLLTLHSTTTPSKTQNYYYALPRPPTKQTRATHRRRGALATIVLLLLLLQTYEFRDFRDRTSDKKRAVRQAGRDKSSKQYDRLENPSSALTDARLNVNNSFKVLITIYFSSVPLSQ